MAKIWEILTTLAKTQVKGRKWLNKKTELAIITVTAVLIGFKTYSLAIVHIGDNTDLSPNIGNFERVRNSLKEQRTAEKFSFAVISNSHTTRTFEQLCDDLRNGPLSFMVILGDFVKTSTKGNQDYFKYECMKKYHLSFPVFLIASNHDVVCEEKTFGGLYHAVVLTIDNESVSEKAILARNARSTTNDLRHFAIAMPAPFLTKHRVLTVPENFFLFSSLYVSSVNFIDWRKTLWPLTSKGR